MPPALSSLGVLWAHPELTLQRGDGVRLTRLRLRLALAFDTCILVSPGSSLLPWASGWGGAARARPLGSCGQCRARHECDLGPWGCPEDGAGSGQCGPRLGEIGVWKVRQSYV